MSCDLNNPAKDLEREKRKASTGKVDRQVKEKG